MKNNKSSSKKVGNAEEAKNLEVTFILQRLENGQFTFPTKDDQRDSKIEK